VGTLTRLAWIAAVTGCLALPAAPALSVEATVNVEVPAGKWKGVRLFVRALAPKLPDAKPSPPDKDRSKERQI